MSQAVAYTVSPQLLAREDFREACTARNFGEAFKLMRQWDGASQDRICSPVDGLTQSRVSRIMKGEDRIATMDLIERISDSLRIPGELVGLARRPWEQSAPVDPSASDVDAPAVQTATLATAGPSSSVAVVSEATRQLARELGTDPVTVDRWVQRGSAPHVEAAGAGEVVAFYAHRSQVPKNFWLDLVLSAQDRIDVLTYASLFLPEDNPEALDVIKHKAFAGAKVRFALGDPDSPELALRGREEGLGDAIPGRVRMALAYYQPIMDTPGVEFHLHRTTLYNSILRFDDQMIINQHIYGTYGYCAPVLHLRRTPNGDLFDTYARSFDLAWAESYPYTPPT
jgi:hypothetical protein